MAVKQLDHVEAAVAIGASRSRILRKHVLPLSMTPVLVNATTDFGNVVLLFAVMTLIGATLTMPGIAGVILTIGMAVDANVLIFERIKEELAAGRTVRAAIGAGFGKAWTAVV